METGELVSYGLMAIGFATIGWAAWSAMQVGVNHYTGNTVLMKLLSANNHSRARKLCRTAPGSYLDAVGAAIDAATASGSKDLATLIALATPSFDAKGVAVTERWRGIIERGYIGVMGVLGGVGLALTGGALPLPHAIAGGVALIAAGWFLYRRRTAQVALDTARREVVPAIAKSIIDAPSETPARADDTGPFRQLGVPKVKLKGALASLRDGQCALCGPTSTRAIAREDGRFAVFVCTGCGYTQEFADLSRLEA